MDLSANEALDSNLQGAAPIIVDPPWLQQPSRCPSTMVNPIATSTTSLSVQLIVFCPAQAREAEYEAEQEKIRKEKELETARLRALQEKAQDHQAEQVYFGHSCLQVWQSPQKEVTH